MDKTSFPERLVERGHTIFITRWVYRKSVHVESRMLGWGGETLDGSLQPRA